MTASTTLGFETSTSRASRGRSMKTDLFTPSLIDCLVEPASTVTISAVSPAHTIASRASKAAMASIVTPPRTSLRRSRSIIATISLQLTSTRRRRLFDRVHFTGDAVPDDGDAAALLGPAEQMVGVGFRFARLALGIGDRTQRKRQARAYLLSDRQDLGLLRTKLERRGLADNDLLAVLVLDRLVDGEDTDIVQDGFGRELRRGHRTARIRGPRHL